MSGVLCNVDVFSQSMFGSATEQSLKFKTFTIYLNNKLKLFYKEFNLYCLDCFLFSFLVCVSQMLRQLPKVFQGVFSQIHKAKLYSTLTKSKPFHYSRYIFLPGSLCFIAFTQKNTPTSLTQGTKNKKMSDEQQNLQSVLENADQLFDENHFQEVYDVLCKYQNQSLSEIQWRKARALFQLSKTVKDKERSTLIRQSYDLIKSALDTDDNSFAIHKWMAIILDAYAELDGLKSRITQLDTVSKHMKRAIELHPTDATSWYLLGAFEFGLADLPWIQRKIVSTVFATPPTGTYEKALEYFTKAESLKEGFYSMNWLMIGKCHYALKDYENAKKFFEKAANCRVLNEDDKNCKEEAQKLFKKC